MGNGEVREVLIVDDDPVYSRLVAAALKSCGHRVVIRNQALGTTQAVSRGDFDVILLDLDMPALSGEALAGVIRKSAREGDKQPAVVLLSGAPEEVLAEKSAAVGAAGWISKSVPAAKLSREIARVVGNG